MAPGYPYRYPQPGWAPTDPRPRYLPVVPNEAPPPGYVYEERVKRGPFIGGLITFGVPYSLGLLVISQDSENKKGLLGVPWFGPWLTLLARHSTCDQSLPISDCSEDFGARLLIVIDGILQTGGGIMAASALFNPQKRYARQDLAPQAQQPQQPQQPQQAPQVSPGPQVSLVPRFFGRAPGVTLFGAF